MSTESKLKKNIGRLVILTIAGSLIYGLPYFRSYYYDAYLEAYNLTNTQMAMFGSMFGVFGAISYLFGGVVADMVSTKKLLSVSLVVSGLAGFLHLMNPGYVMLLVIYMIWGFTSLFAFWPALLKALRGMANEHEQSKAYGFMEGGRGVVNAIHLAVTLALFTYLSNKIGDLAGLNGVIIFYSVVVILLGVLVFFTFHDEENGETGEKTKFTAKQVVDVLKYPAVWILSLILCCTYTMNIAFYYFTPYATAAFGVTATAGAVITMMAQYIRPFASAGGGIVADRIGRSKTFSFGFILMAICTFVIALMGSMPTAMFVALCALIYFGMYFNYGLTFSMMDEGGIPAEVSGTAIGVVCTLGYLPEIFAPLLAGRFLDAYGEIGYKYYFLIVGGIMVVGLFALMLWNRHIRTLNKEKKEAKAEA